MRMLIFIISILLLIAMYFIQGGGYFVLLQPLQFLSILFGVPMLLASKYGFKNSLKYLFTSGTDSKMYIDALYIINGIAIILTILELIIAFGRLNQGIEIFGYGLAATLVTPLYAIVYTLYLVCKKNSRQQN